MKQSHHSKDFWIYFYLVILFMGIITWVMHIVFPFQTPYFIFISYFILYIVIIVGFLYSFRHLDIIINTFKLNKTDVLRIFIVIAFFFVLFMVYNKPMNIQIFLNSFTVLQILATFSEELFFRVFIISILLYNLPEIKLSLSKGYSRDELKGYMQLVGSVIFSSLLFALWHKNEFEFHFITGLFLYGLSFIITNQKIYPSWLLHYYNNMLALNI